ncbi:hypothetical protein B296_00034633 [Ensete ventricosum]|uniref:UspA domain-containing protein n=1 Tax=Ensete ventricosum TaxID=4639 RepID=A0A426Z7J0_ENSVE|nr:hypothetical protein B296_00034633 [Ensete ventricosum]
MGRTSTRLPSFCLNRVTTRVRVRSPAIESRPLSPQASKVSNVDDEFAADGATKEMEQGRRIMIVVDRSSEAKAALHWALSHSVQSNDTVVLVEVTKPSKHVELSLVTGEERGPAIVGEASKRGVVLLVMGQRKRSVTWRWVMMWAGSQPGGDAVDYCIRNATCMALAVRRKSRRGGGYLITTKRHRDFWLLA